MCRTFSCSRILIPWLYARTARVTIQQFARSRGPQVVNGERRECSLRQLVSMSVSQLISRLKNWLPLDREQRRLQQLRNVVEGNPKKRKPFNTKVQLPWYSTSRLRNVAIISIAAMIFMFWDSFKLAHMGIKHGLMLERERRKFLKELDEEDRLFEERLIAASKPTIWLLWTT